MNIVFLSHTLRNSLFKVGSYHLSREFVRMGHRVLYIPSALSPFHFLNVQKLRNEEYMSSLKNRMSTLSPVMDDDGVLNLTPFVLTPFNRGVFSNPATPVNQWFTFNKVDKKIKETGFDQADMVIQDKAGLYFMRKFIRAGTWIYRATDDYSRMPSGPGKKSLIKLEQIICNFADQVMVTSRPLQRLFEERYQVDAMVIRNGVDVSHFAGERSRPEEYSSTDKPIILYVGSLDERFDYELLAETARLSPEMQFIIIGPGGRESGFQKISNVTFLGPKPYDEIPAYMQHADIGILPLKQTEANHARSPMKIYEYGISGLPVVSTPLRELIYRNEKFVSFAKDSRSFREELQHGLTHKEDLASEAQKSSEKHSWNSIAQQMLELTVVSGETV